MKYKGNKREFNAERDAALRAAFRMEMATCTYICVDELAVRVVMSECPRFYVSEERARTVISQLIRGARVLEGMLPAKRRMFEEIYRRVVALGKRRRKDPLCALINEVIYSPAPEFYLSPRTAKDIIFSEE